MEGDCNVYAHSSLWMRPTGEWSINVKMVYSNTETQGSPNMQSSKWYIGIVYKYM